jgi:cytochrome c oxidase cbb3-type subunit 4
MMHSIWTLVLFLGFIGVVFWAYSGKRKAQFDEAARLALEDDDVSSRAPATGGER